MKSVSIDELPGFYELLKDKAAPEILKWAWDKFGDGLGMTTAFGYSGIVMMHHLFKLGISPDIYFIDTGFHFPETLELLKTIKDEWSLKIRRVKIDEVLREYVYKVFGPQPWGVNPNICCHYFKVEPLLRILPEKVAWLSSLRRDQSRTRSSIEIVEIDGRGTFQISPFANWTKEQAWDYIRKHNLLYNPLHDRHYPSIGCQPCTVPVEEGGDERDGRWKSSPKLECGLHFRK